MLVNRARNRTLALALVAAASVAWPATAADRLTTGAVPAADELPVAPRNLPPMAAANGGRPDISALRYYAVRGEQDRLQAEADRLSTLYPDWKRPENIFTDEDPQEQALWKLFSKGGTAGVEREIARLRSLGAGFEPSSVLLEKLDERRRRESIAKAWSERRWDDVIAGADATPDLLLGTDVELIWFVADAYANKERPQAAADAFQAALNASTREQERLATLQKAAAVLPPDATLDLLQRAEGSLRDDASRRTVEDAIVRGALVRMAQLGEAVPTALRPALGRFATRAQAAPEAGDPLLLAWASFGQRQWKEARAWFGVALRHGPDIKAREGAIMAAMRAGDLSDAADLVNADRDASPEIGALFISLYAPTLLQEKPAVLPTPFLQDYADRSLTLENGEGGEALGWYAFNLGQLQAARAWFGKAMAWEATGTAAYGLALTALRMKDRPALEALKSTYGVQYPRVAGVKFEPRRAPKRVTVKRRSRAVDRAGKLRGEIARLQKRGRAAACLSKLRDLRAFGPLRAGDHQMRGWCLMKADRPAEAEQAFATAVRLGGKGRVPSAYGQALAALKAGRTNDALAIANANPLTARQRRTVDIELLTQRARAAFANRDYAATILALDERAKLTGETRDLSFLRGWAHYHTGRLASAESIFAALDAQLSNRQTRRGLAAARREQTRKVSHDR